MPALPVLVITMMIMTIGDGARDGSHASDSPSGLGHVTRSLVTSDCHDHLHCVTIGGRDNDGEINDDLIDDAVQHEEETAATESSTVPDYRQAGVLAQAVRDANDEENAAIDAEEKRKADADAAFEATSSAYSQRELAWLKEKTANFEQEAKDQERQAQEYAAIIQRTVDVAEAKAKAKLEALRKEEETAEAARVEARKKAMEEAEAAKKKEIADAKAIVDMQQQTRAEEQKKRHEEREKAKQALIIKDRTRISHAFTTGDQSVLAAMLADPELNKRAEAVLAATSPAVPPSSSSSVAPTPTHARGGLKSSLGKLDHDCQSLLLIGAHDHDA